MANYLVPCPHCASSVTIQASVISKGHSGSVAGSCPRCHKMVTIEIRDGQVHSVHK